MYLQGYASIRHVQNLYHFHLAGSTKHDYLGLPQVELIFMCFHADKAISFSFSTLHVAHLTVTDTSINKIHLVHFPLDMSQISLSLQYPI